MNRENSEICIYPIWIYNCYFRIQDVKPSNFEKNKNKKSHCHFNKHFNFIPNCICPQVLSPSSGECALQRPMSCERINSQKNQKSHTAISRCCLVLSRLTKMCISFLGRNNDQTRTCQLPITSQLRHKFTLLQISCYCDSHTNVKQTISTFLLTHPSVFLKIIFTSLYISTIFHSQKLFTGRKALSIHCQRNCRRSQQTCNPYSAFLSHHWVTETSLRAHRDRGHL